MCEASRKSNLADRLATRMDELHLSQADLARRSGLSTGHVSDLVNGKRGKRISADTAGRLASALKVSPKFFYPASSHMRIGRARRKLE